MKTISKILLLFFIMTVTTLIMPQCETKATPTDVMNGVTIEANYAGSSKAIPGMKDVVNKLLGFLQIASALIAVVMIAATGFRYIIETPEMKNELKKSMIPIIVGILLVFFAASIAKFFVGMFG